MKEVLDKIVPSEEERQKIEKLSKKLVSVIDSIGYTAEIFGSISRGTWLAGEGDIDVFISFRPNVSRKVLEEQGLKIGKEVFKKLKGRYEIGYAEHPYVRGKISGIKIDIVPHYRMRNLEVKSAVDRTPFHDRYVHTRLKPNQIKHVLLLKQWCRGQGIYGSELKTQGLSGYLCELLIIKYGTFNSALRAISEWKPAQIIDLKKHYSQAEHPEVRQHFDAPLIVIDPVDLKRNVAAVLSRENFKVLVSAAKRYVETPSPRFFFPKPVKEKNPAHFKNCLFVTFKREKVVEDILWPQMRRTSKIMAASMEAGGFKVKKTGVWANGKSILVFKLDSLKTGKNYTHLGPPKRMKDACKIFREKYPKARMKDGRLTVKRTRRYTTADSFAKAFLEAGEGIASHLPAKTAKACTSPKKIYKEEFPRWLSRWY